MGLDIYIEARIKEKATGRIISSSDTPEYEDEEDKGFFEVCSWGSRAFSDVRDGMINICNKYLNANYSNNDFVIPVTQNALREIYGYLLKRSYISDNDVQYLENNSNDWLNKSCYENDNLRNAGKLHSLLAEMERIKYENVTFDYSRFIPDKKDYADFVRSPQSYDWEFRIFNSY